jgi:hypothetical protein
MGLVEGGFAAQFSDAHKRLKGGFGYVKPDTLPPDIPKIVETATAPLVRRIAGLQKQIDALTLSLADMVDKVVNYGERLEGVEYRLPKPLNETDIKVHEVVRVVSRFEGISVSLIRGERRTKKIVYCRHLISFLSSELTGRSLVIIGSALGNRDHTTILHGIRKIERRLKTDGELQVRIEFYRGQLANLTPAPATP